MRLQLCRATPRQTLYTFQHTWLNSPGNSGNIYPWSFKFNTRTWKHCKISGKTILWYIWNSVCSWHLCYLPVFKCNSHNLTILKNFLYLFLTCMEGNAYVCAHSSVSVYRGLTAMNAIYSVLLGLLPGPGLSSEHWNPAILTSPGLGSEACSTMTRLFYEFWGSGPQAHTANLYSPGQTRSDTLHSQMISNSPLSLCSFTNIFSNYMGIRIYVHIHVPVSAKVKGLWLPWSYRGCELPKVGAENQPPFSLTTEQSNHCFLYQQLHTRILLNNFKRFCYYRPSDRPLLGDHRPW